MQLFIHHRLTPGFPIPQLNYKMSLLCLDDSQEKKYGLGECSKINRHSGETRLRLGRDGYCSNDRTARRAVYS